VEDEGELSFFPPVASGERQRKAGLLFLSGRDGLGGAREDKQEDPFFFFFSPPLPGRGGGRSSSFSFFFLLFLLARYTKKKAGGEREILFFPLFPLFVVKLQF